MEMGSMGEAKTWLLVAAIRGWRLIDLGFSRRGQYIVERAMSVAPEGPTPCGRAAKGGTRHHLVWLPPWSPSSLLRTPCT